MKDLLGLLTSKATDIFRSQYFKLIKWIGLLILAFLFFMYSLKTDVFVQLSEVSWINLSIFFVVILVTRVLYAKRWQYLCFKFIKLNRCSIIFFIRTNLLAEFSEIAMLSSLSSDAARLIKTCERIGHPQLCATSIVGDRVSGLISMILLALVLSPVLVTKIDRRISVPWSFLILGCCIFLLIASIVWTRYRRKFYDFISFIAERMSFKSIANALILSIIGHLCFASSYYFLFREANTVSLLSIWSIVFTAQLSNVIPLSFFGIALGEASIIALSGLLGVTQASAIAVVAIVVASKYVFALAGFLIELFVDGREFFRAMQKSRSSQPESVSTNDLSR